MIEQTNECGTSPKWPIHLHRLGHGSGESRNQKQLSSIVSFQQANCIFRKKVRMLTLTSWTLMNIHSLQMIQLRHLSILSREMAEPRTTPPQTPKPPTIEPPTREAPTAEPGLHSEGSRTPEPGTPEPPTPEAPAANPGSTRTSLGPPSLGRPSPGRAWSFIRVPGRHTGRAGDSGTVAPGLTGWTGSVRGPNRRLRWTGPACTAIVKGGREHIPLELVSQKTTTTTTSDDDDREEPQSEEFCFGAGRFAVG